MHPGINIHVVLKPLRIRHVLRGVSPLPQHNHTWQIVYLLVPLLVLYPAGRAKSMSEDSNKLARSLDRDVMLLPDFAKEIESELENNSSSTRTQIDLKPKSTSIGTLIAQPVFGLRISSSIYK